MVYVAEGVEEVIFWLQFQDIVRHLPRVMDIALTAPSLQTFEEEQEVWGKAIELATPPVKTKGNGAPKVIALKRSGERPLQFTGTEVCNAMGHSLGTSLWFELNIYRASNDFYVTNVRMFWKSPSEKDQHIVASHDSLDEAISYLEGMDLRKLVASQVDVSSTSKTTAEIIFEAAELRQKIDVAERQYRSVLGDVLYELRNAR